MNDEPKDSNQEVVEKLDQVVELLKAIDWKLWLYLKANKYIDE